MATKAKKKNETGESVIRIEGMHKWFGNFHALKDIDLEVFQGEKIVICGPSGSGKSTLIRCINRLEEHQQGIINVHGTNLTNDLKDIETIRSDVGMVFQSFNLFPHLTILENCVLASQNSVPASQNVFLACQNCAVASQNGFGQQNGMLANQNSMLASQNGV